MQSSGSIGIKKRICCDESAHETKYSPAADRAKRAAGSRRSADAGVDVRTVARDVFDVQGAGDTAIAALALAQRAGASLFEAAVLANAAAGVVVGKVGTATASPQEVRALLPEAVAAAGDAV